MNKIFLLLALLVALSISAQSNNFIEENYSKVQAMVPMRDGAKLYTAIYIPKDISQVNIYPFLMERTPYSAGPYEKDKLPVRLGPNTNLMKEKYIFVYQDVRGRYMSEGVNLEVTPFIKNKKSVKDVDENSDTYDTIEWLLKNIKYHNGSVGIWGISYPGFYATSSLPNAHPAIKAVSPQAPVTDEFIGDDANHNGAFFLLDNFSFMSSFGKPRSGPVESYGGRIFNPKITDAYDFFLKLGPLSNTQSAEYFNHQSYIWNEYLEHDTYDNYWRSRNIRPHLKNIKVPVLIVGGWFDAEDLFGALRTYEAIEKQSPGNKTRLVVGPWTHGAWAATSWEKFGPHQFGANINQFYKDSIEAVFFNYYLKGKGSYHNAEAMIYETGNNSWRSFPSWPPPNIKYKNIYLSGNGMLSTVMRGNAYSEYVSDPANPVPYTDGKWAGRNNLFVVEDQSFAAKRPDVLMFTGEVLKEDLTLYGPVKADLVVSTSGTDADFVVKLIDVLPDGGYQQLVRAEIMRGKFRNSFEKPQPFVPNKSSKVKFTLNDVAHTFKKGHRLMIQVQSSWFPLADRNPQKFMRIPDAKENDFKKARIRIYHSSKIQLPVSMTVPK